MTKWAGILLTFTAVLVAVTFIVITANRELSTLENTLFQVLILAFGLIGSYVFGKESAVKAARELIKPHARSAFRRLVSLNRSLARLTDAIQSSRPLDNSNPSTTAICDRLEGIVIEQIATASDALEDWRDIVPEDVEELYKQLAAKRAMETSK